MPDEKPVVVVEPASGHAKLEKFDGLSDVDRFLDHFEVVARANNWNQDKQALQLPTALTGAAFDLYRRLAKDERDTVTKLRDALQKEFGTSALESDYALLFASRRRHPGETLADFGEALKTLGRKAYPKFADDQLELLCKTGFINGGLDENLRVQLLVGSGTTTESFRDLITRARRLEQVLSRGRVAQISEQEHVLTGEVQRLAAMVSALGEKVEALSTAARTKPQSPGTPCPVCGQEGHWAKHCPKKKKTTEAIVCFKCKQPGHMARGCANFS